MSGRIGPGRISADQSSESASALPNADGTVTASLVFSPDNALDIGASGANRPRNLFLAGDANIADQLLVTGAGPHSIGGATNTAMLVRVAGTIATAGAHLHGVALEPTLSPGVGFNAYVQRILGTINEAASGTHNDFAGLLIEPPTIVAGGAAVNTASTLIVNGAPSGASINLAIQVVSGNSNFAPGTAADAGVSLGDVGNGLFRPTGNTIGFTTLGVERGRITSAGVLAWGTTVVTGATAGDRVTGYGTFWRSVDFAGTGLLRAASFGTFGGLSDILVLGQEASDIAWGKALVALGGGAGATLGTIGGSGPATATQNTWMRAIDSTGAAFWLPVWK